MRATEALKLAALDTDDDVKNLMNDLMEQRHVHGDEASLGILGDEQLKNKIRAIYRGNSSQTRSGIAGGAIGGIGGGILGATMSGLAGGARSMPLGISGIIPGALTGMSVGKNGRMEKEIRNAIMQHNKENGNG